jgi:hypothetical protein
MEWSLPKSPNAPEYQALVRLLAQLKDEGADEDYRTLKRSVAEKDFWFFLRHVSSFGTYLCDDPDHEHHGKPWAEHPFIFRLARLRQGHIEDGVRDVWVLLPRFHFKTTVVTTNETAWVSLKSPQLTTLIVTWKLEDTGEAIFGGLRRELFDNDEIRFLWPEVVAQEEQVAGRRKASQTTKKLFLSRPLGPKEPTITITGIMGSAASGHFDRIVVDDVVTEKSLADSAVTVEAVARRVKLLAALEKDVTTKVYVNNRWGVGDPYDLIETESPGFFGPKVSFTCRDSSGRPLLRSDSYLRRMEQQLGPNDYAAQFMNSPVAASGVRVNLAAMLNSVYHEAPRVEAKSCRIHMTLDGAGGRGKKTGSDRFAYAVVGLHPDDRFRLLDMMSHRATQDEQFSAYRKAILQWNPEVIWVEDIGAGANLYALRKDLQYEGLQQYADRCRLLPTGAMSRRKEERISLLVASTDRSQWVWPADGVGHGTPADSTDSFEQFKRREVSTWSKDRRDPEDNVLDCLAWFVQPEMRLSWPRAAKEFKSGPSPEDIQNLIVQSCPVLRRWSGVTAKGSGSGRDPSWRVA